MLVAVQQLPQLVELAAQVLELLLAQLHIPAGLAALRTHHRLAAVVELLDLVALAELEEADLRALSAQLQAVLVRGQAVRGAALDSAQVVAAGRLPQDTRLIQQQQELRRLPRRRPAVRPLDATKTQEPAPQLLAAAAGHTEEGQAGLTTRAFQTVAPELFALSITLQTTHIPTSASNHGCY